MELVDRLRQGDRRALARILTLLERQEPEARRLSAALHRLAGPAHTVGVTGPPGAGKSTLIARLVAALRQRLRDGWRAALPPDEEGSSRRRGQRLPARATLITSRPSSR